MTRAMLLCAGYGTRLGDLSLELPKPLLPVCDIPILRYGVTNLIGHGIPDIAINLLHHGDQIEREIGDGSAFGARVHYSRETALLGTGGGLKNALDFLDADGRDQPIVSLNGKLVFDIDLGALLAAFEADPDVLGMMVVRKVPDAMTWGAVDVAIDNTGRHRVRNVLGQGDYMFCGVHVTRPSVLRRLPDGEACMIRQGYLPWLLGGEPVAAHIVSDVYFAEHSTPAHYLGSNLALVAGARFAHPPGPLTGIDRGAEVDPSADIRLPVRIAAGAIVERGARVGPHAVIGRGARVTAGASVESAVVWPAAKVTGDVASAIVTPARVVAVDRAIPPD